ncbi:hypothetical protein H9P43_003672 [Blastocladiella emersonii ATCC 22665]|nr:hypothetical protein H9P43_003672 [Blastocladiella emersonii ATCC 22665]
MASNVRYFAPIEDIQVLSTKSVSEEKATAILRKFVEGDATAHNVPNETVYQLKQVLGGITGENVAAAPEDGDADMDGQ